MILKWLMPYRYVPSVSSLDPDALQGAGIRGVILDLDNTIVPWGAREPAPEVVAWVARLRQLGVRACIVSNNVSGRARTIGEILRLPVIAGAAKPGPWAFRRAMRIMGTPAAQTALVGDQLFTDVFGGNLLGLRTILVDPLSTEEFASTRVVRAVERLIRPRILRRLHKRHS